MYKKISCASIALLIALHADAISWTRKDVTQPLDKKQTTVLVYIAGDNNLAPYINPDIKEMEKVGSNDNLNILVYVGSRDNSGKWARKLVVEKGATYQDGADMDKDSGDAQTAIDAINWAHSKFPSDNFVLVFWNHGSGPTNRNENQPVTTFFGKPWGLSDRAFCYDDTTGSYFTDQDLMDVLAYANQLRNKQIDILAFDACLMAMVEVAYAAHQYAKFLVASEETIPGYGYPYNTALSVAAQADATPRKIVKDMVHDYGAIYKNMGDYTLSGTNLNKLPRLSTALDEVATQLLNLLNSADSGVVAQAIERSSDTRYCTYFTETSYIDLGHFLKNLRRNMKKRRINMKNNRLRKELKSAISTALRALRRCVVTQVKGSYYPDAKGLAIYMERYGSLDPYYASTQWAKESKWAQMLEAYIAS